MKNFGIKLDRTLDFLLGNIKEVTQKTFVINDGVKQLNEHSTRKYNSRGFKISSIYYDNEGGVKLKQICHFDNNGNKIGYTNYDENDDYDSYGK
jgi:hypothetical protein